jgi:integrase
MIRLNFRQQSLFQGANENYSAHASEFRPRCISRLKASNLASFLVRIKTDPKTVQTLLRHSDVKMTLQCYTHSVSDDRMAAEGAN